MKKYNNKPSIQQHLFELLDRQQRSIVARNLWPLKAEAQEILCHSLISFLEHAEVFVPQNVVLSLIFSALTGVDIMDEKYDPRSREGISPNSDFDQARK
ncbi:MAG: hypothetical protein MJZ45_01120 [Bacteroidales bacterium]|nr:hypothetical protein [Bacteroidales bacterium]